jgi:hypothetical protein
MTEADASKKIMDKIYAAREQIHEETKHLADKEYAAYFNDRAQAVIARNGYTAVRSKDGMGYTLHKLNN